MAATQDLEKENLARRRCLPQYGTGVAKTFR
jgi:hypothetical protein